MLTWGSSFAIAASTVTQLTTPHIRIALLQATTSWQVRTFKQVDESSCPSPAHFSQLSLSSASPPSKACWQCLRLSVPTARVDAMVCLALFCVHLCPLHPAQPRMTYCLSVCLSVCPSSLTLYGMKFGHRQCRQSRSLIKTHKDVSQLSVLI